MPDQLRGLSDQRDRANASRSRLEPDRLILPPRNQSTRRVCVSCYQPIDEFKLRQEWWDRMSWEERRRARYSSPTKCPNCSGRLIEVTS